MLAVLNFWKGVYFGGIHSQLVLPCWGLRNRKIVRYQLQLLIFHDFCPICSDAQQGTITATCSPASSSSFGIGTAAVACVFVDSGSLSSQCSYNVVVQGIVKYFFFLVLSFSICNPRLDFPILHINSLLGVVYDGCSEFKERSTV